MTSPLRSSRDEAPLRWWREARLLVMIYAAYEVSRALDNASLPTAVANARAILNWERRWHLAPERVFNQVLVHSTGLAVISSYFYATLHYVVTPAVLIWMYRRHRAQYRLARTSLAIGTALGLLGFSLVPTAPPRLLAGSGIRDTLASVHQWGWWSSEGSVPRGLGGLSNQFAAMPSLHVGWALWCGFLLVRLARRRWVRLLGAAYPFATTIVVLATGNHYLLDAVAGAATIVLGLAAALLLRSLVARTRVQRTGVHLGAGRTPSGGLATATRHCSSRPDTSIAGVGQLLTARPHGHRP